MATDAPARLLDITRLVSRIGRGPLTGVDRVEVAYLDRFTDDHAALFLLLRTPFGYLILPGSTGGLIRSWLEGTTMPPAVGRLARMGQHASPHVLAEAALRRAALARAWRGGLGRRVRRMLPDGGEYFNVGHSNLTERTLVQLSRVPGLRVTVMIHDTIPLDHPRFSAPGAAAAFGAKLAAAARHATRLICPSVTVRADVARWCAPGAAPPITVAHLGIGLAAPDPKALPSDLTGTRPYFVALGTVEPRKNHALLLDAWDHLRANLPPDDVPTLVIAGRRGWNNAAVFQRLDALRQTDAPIREASGLPDAAVAALLLGARALLMPSFAEGFGLPVAEAVTLGIPVIATDLPAYREICGNSPVYLDPNDHYQWAAKIQELAVGSGKRTTGGTATAGLTWASHFRTVLRPA